MGSKNGTGFRFEKFEPVHRVSGKNFFETGLQTGLSEPGHSPNFDLYTRDALPVEVQSRLRSLTLMTNSLRKTIFTSVRLLGILVCDHQK